MKIKLEHFLLILAVVVVLIAFFPIWFDKPLFLYDEREVVFDEYRIVSFICYGCKKHFEPGNGDYLSGHVYCKECVPQEKETK